MAVVEAERRVTVVYVMNRMVPDVFGSERSNHYLRTVFDDWTGAATADRVTPPRA
jgi:hypothetical protein